MQDVREPTSKKFIVLFFNKIGPFCMYSKGISLLNLWHIRTIWGKSDHAYNSKAVIDEDSIQCAVNRHVSCYLKSTLLASRMRQLKSTWLKLQGNCLLTFCDKSHNTAWKQSGLHKIFLQTTFVRPSLCQLHRWAPDHSSEHLFCLQLLECIIVYRVFLKMSKRH